MRAITTAGPSAGFCSIAARPAGATRRLLLFSCSSSSTASLATTSPLNPARRNTRGYANSTPSGSYSFAAVRPLSTNSTGRLSGSNWLYSSKQSSRTEFRALRNLRTISSTAPNKFRFSPTLNSPDHPYRMSSAATLPNLPIFEAIARHKADAPAVVHSVSGRTFTYGQLLNDVAAARAWLVKQGEQARANGAAANGSANGKGLRGERVAFLAENGYDYVVTLLAILGSHAIAVPLSPAFPANELRYILEQSQALLLLSTEKFQSKSDEVVKEELSHKVTTAQLHKILEGGKNADSVTIEDDGGKEGGIMLYTSGTTSRPKGVLLPQSVLTAQSLSLLKAWEYSPSDRLLHVLPLHHIHGTINALLTPLFSGSTIEFMFPFNPEHVWQRLAGPFLPHSQKQKITFLTVVPTIYNRLLTSHPRLSEELQTASREALKPENLRLNISGSAALPTPTKQAWSELSSGNVLLERFGMTEVGMALSCGLSFHDRVDGSVGWPLPSVEARLVDTETNEIIQPGEELDKDGKPRHGEIQLRGPTIFNEYWRNPEATAKEFVEGSDGNGKWFKTGDVAIRQTVEGAGTGSSGSWATGPLYFIQGRKSADIIKTGGEKVSALEIEREMLSLPEVAEVAVVALKSEQWGQKVAAVVVLTEQGKTAGKGGKQWTALDMRRALRERLANYKIPQDLKVVETIPRNAMGKINKKTLVKDVFGEEA